MRDINLLHPKFQPMCKALLMMCADAGLNVKVTQTLRTEAEQQALYAQGRKSLVEVNKLRALAKMAPITHKENKWATNASTVAKSYHGYGLAFDIAIFSPDGKRIDWSPKVDWNDDGVSDWVEVGRMAAHIEGLEWGGNWTKSPDMPHFQCTFGLTIKDLMEGKRP